MSEHRGHGIFCIALQCPLHQLQILSSYYYFRHLWPRRVLDFSTPVLFWSSSQVARPEAYVAISYNEFTCVAKMFVWKKLLTNFLPVQSILTNDEINEKPSPYLQKHLLLMTNSFSSLPEVSLSQCSSAITSSRFVLPLSWTIAEEVTAASSLPFVCELYFIAASQIKTPRKTFKGFVCDQVQMSRCDFQALGNLRPVSFSESHPWNSLKTLCSSHTWYCTNSPTCHVCSWFCDFFFQTFSSPLTGCDLYLLCLVGIHSSFKG